MRRATKRKLELLAEQKQSRGAGAERTEGKSLRAKEWAALHLTGPRVGRS